MRSVTVVVPTIGRESLPRLLASLDHSPRDERIDLRAVVVVDDRPAGDATLLLGDTLDMPVVVAASRARGPAAARNVGAASVDSEWIVFLDDDVEVDEDWWCRLASDLDASGPLVGAVFGRIQVPLPVDRRPTDAERNTAQLSTSRWITADAAMRRTAFEAVEGFDEGFRRAYREDSDIALRLLDAGWHLENGKRITVHPPRRAAWHSSIGSQRGNAADARMAAKHGADFRQRLDEQAPLDWFHASACVAAVIGLAGVLRSRPTIAVGAGGIWASLIGRFALTRIAAGPRTAPEVAAMSVTSAVIPPTALWHRVAGTIDTRRRR